MGLGWGHDMGSNFVIRIKKIKYFENLWDNSWMMMTCIGIIAMQGPLVFCLPLSFKSFFLKSDKPKVVDQVNMYIIDAISIFVTG